MASTSGERIRAARTSAGLTQVALAGRLGVVQQIVSQVELGIREPWPALRVRLALALDIPEVELFSPSPEDDAAVDRLVGVVGAFETLLSGES